MALRSQQAHGTFELLGVMGTGLIKNLLVKGINRVNEQTAAVCALSAVEQRQIKEWQLYIFRMDTSLFGELARLS